MERFAPWKRTGIVLGGYLVAMLGCAAELDTQRHPVDTGSFGHKLMTLACKRVVYLSDLGEGDARVDVSGERYRELCRTSEVPAEAPADLMALQAVRPTLVAAIDAMMPESFLGDVQAYLTSEEFLSIYDDGTVTGAVDALVGMLELAAGDDESMQAFERLGLREGYTPASASQGALRVILDYPGLADVLLHGTRELAPGGSAHPAFQRTMRALAATLRNIEAGADPEDPQGTARLALDLLFGEEPSLRTGAPMFIVSRDSRGVARILVLGSMWPGPFVDMDGDGLADVDELGRFVDASGQLIDAPTPFPVPDKPDAMDPAWIRRDDQGRAIDDVTGLPVYEYIDLDKTLFAALARDASALMDPDTGTAIDALIGLSALMGPREPATRTYDNGEVIEYTGFDVDDAALLDMLYGYLQLLRDPGIYDTLELVRVLLRSHEAELSRMAEALVQAGRIAGMFPDVSLEPGSPLYDDLVPVLREILATPGLFEDLMKAMEDPRMADFGPRIADFMTYAGEFRYDPVTHGIVGELDRPVDRSMPDTGFNRSIWQRILHLLSDASGATLCNRPVTQINLGAIVVNKSYDECALFRVDDLAVFYVRSLAYARDENGNFIYDDEGEPVHAAHLDLMWNDPILEAAVTDEVMEIATGIEGFGEHPTPAALGRVLFLDPRPELIATLTDPPRTRHGELFAERHGGALPGWELYGFLDTKQPLVQPFVDHGAEALFVDLLEVLNKHWPSRESADHQQEDPDAPGYAWASGAVVYEPIIAEILRSSDLLPSVLGSAPTLNTVVVNGKSLAAILGGTGLFFLTPQPGLANRQGETTTTTADGRPVSVLSPWHILADAYAKKAELLAAAPEAAAAWDEAVSEIIDVLGRGQYDPDTGWRFANPRLRGVGMTLIDFLRDRLLAHDAQGDRAEWLAGALPEDMEEILGGPLVAGLVDSTLALGQAPEARRALEGLLAYALDEQESPDAFRGMLVSLSQVMYLVALDQRDMVPLGRMLGEIIDPARGWMDAQLSFALAARLAEGELAKGERSTLVTLLQHGVTEYGPGHTPLGDIIEGVAEVHRARPYVDLNKAYTSEDYPSLLRGIASFLGEEKHGLRQLITIIQSRNIE